MGLETPVKRLTVLSFTLFTKLKQALIVLKTRAAPLKALSIPRLERMSARILSVLMNTVLTALNSQAKLVAADWVVESFHFRCT